jgi:hypothetical protein
MTRPTVGDAVPAAMKFNHERFIWHCRLCLLMPDHLHAIIAFPREPGMATTVKNWKKFVAGKYGVYWQRDFFDHWLRDHHELGEKTSYILMNPVRKGLVPASRGLDVGISSQRPPAADLVGRAVLWQLAGVKRKHGVPGTAVACAGDSFLGGFQIDIELKGDS